MEKTFILVYKLGNTVTQVAEGSVTLCQNKRTELKKQQQYKSGKLILRTKDGLKANPNWKP